MIDFESAWMKSNPVLALRAMASSSAARGLVHAPEAQVAVAHAHDPLGRRLLVTDRVAIRMAARPFAERALPLAGRRRDHSGGQPRERAAAARRAIGREREQRVQPDARGEVLGADVPEPVQLAAEQEPLLQRVEVPRLRAGGEPLDGGLRVRVVVAATLHGLELRRPEDARGHLGRESDEIVGMRLADGVHLAAGMELLGGEGADRLEQRIALARAHHAHEALLDERVELVERAVALVLAVADLLHRLERPAFVEDGDAAQQPLLRSRRGASSSS